ncbi:tRNA (cytidine(34)-2'-O)-methyltransferase [Quadrisphaera sp. DSM 44207]|uniref:tRNA (cytidine(34)-2'-O)-methyltransferase n=1 Tax=Quadrisphaera sp. DSM 44207 TaxID=1881057 RepID=UPI00087F91B9|nr:tRNA (cytidine(34)-2'-O)-methyltransferase [Quadrisphaera sp. DSM 44207]SDQ12518.1 tRNA (cytidine/uridine-2'-O-)-methyltransferase [Quadrisphaera sp. DSM 44207]
MFHVVLLHPEIPPDTGNAIRMVACTGASLHLVEPLGFVLDDARLRRAGLDYHDLARVHVHADLPALWEALAGDGPLPRVYAFSTAATTRYTDVAYAPGDALLFGRESTGLPEEVQRAPQVTERLRIPMVPGRRSLNLSNSAAIAVHEAWRQHGFAGGA